MSDFIDSEFSALDLGDSRRDDRLRKVLGRMLDSPAKTINSACRGWAESHAAYRLLNNKNVDQAAIFAPHREALIERARHHDCIAVAQDTTELDYTTKSKLDGSGPLNKGRRGFLAHTQFAMTRGRLPLGVLGTDIFARSDEDFGNRRKHLPIEQKESYRWLRSYLDCCELAAELPGTEVLNNSDREGDIYEIYDLWQRRRSAGESTAQWLVRANQDRALLDGDGKPLYKEASGGEILHLFEQARQGRELGTHEFQVKAAKQNKKVKGSTVVTQRQARLVRQRIRVCEVTPRPPYRKKGGKGANGKKLAPVSITIVLAEEIGPPPGQDPITWLLLTSREVSNLEDAMELLEFYQGRWEIEVFHRVLKTGCRVEELQLRNSQAVINAVALYMIVAWRLLYLTHLGRRCPELPCSSVFEEAEWRSVVAIEHAAKRRNRPPKASGSTRAREKLEEPTLGEMIKLVARQGGHLGRKNDGPPGAQVMWQGMEKVRNYATAWEAFGDPGG